jgi:hypothetical protein
MKRWSGFADSRRTQDGHPSKFCSTLDVYRGVSTWTGSKSEQPRNLKELMQAPPLRIPEGRRSALLNRRASLATREARDEPLQRQ